MLLEVLCTVTPKGRSDYLIAYLFCPTQEAQDLVVGTSLVLSASAYHKSTSSLQLEAKPPCLPLTDDPAANPIYSARHD